jgi:hypothetical protein
MAKYSEGDDIRLVKKISFNTTHLRPNTRGEVTKVHRKGLGKTEYSVRFRGVNFDIIVPEKSIVELSYGEG